MLDYQIIDQQIDKALHASRQILHLLHTGEWERIDIENEERTTLVRTLSKCQKTDKFWQNFTAKLSEIQILDQQIVQTSEKIHAQMLNQMCDNRSKSLGCIQYIQQKNDC